MTDSERKLLVALVLMVDQYLDKYGDEVDSRSMSAGEHAIEALARVGLMEIVNIRFGRWTEAGKQFRREEAGIRDPEPIDYPGQIKLVAKSQPEN
jgi:hypothetical protein